MMKYLFTFLSLVILTVGLTTPVSADYVGGGCTPVYGGGVSCPRPGNALVDKKVLNPSTNVYVDNLIPTDLVRFHPANIVSFQILVQNTGDQMVDKVKITDTIPQFVDYSSLDGSAENVVYDSSIKTLYFTVSNLGSGEKRFYTVKVRVVHPAALPEGKNLVCPVNVVVADAAGLGSDRDESQFCIERVSEVTTVPKAGPEHWILTFAGLSTVYFVGRTLINKSKINLKIAI